MASVEIGIHCVFLLESVNQRAGERINRCRRAPHRNQLVYRPVQTNRYPTRVRLLMRLSELFVALQSIIQIRFRSRAGGYDFVCMLGNIHGKKIKVDTGPVIERIDNLFTDKLFTGATTFTLLLGDLRLLPFFLFLQGGDLAIDVFDALWHGTFLSFGYYSSPSSF